MSVRGFVCAKHFAWACVSSRVRRRACLLSVCKRWSVFIPLNHWWDCNSNTGPPVSPPAVCHQLASSQWRSQENQYAALTELRQQTWKLKKKLPLVTKQTKHPRNKQSQQRLGFSCYMCTWNERSLAHFGSSACRNVHPFIHGPVSFTLWSHSVPLSVCL